MSDDEGYEMCPEEVPEILRKPPEEICAIICKLLNIDYAPGGAKKLGQGGMGIVFRVEDKSGKVHAVKICAPGGPPEVQQAMRKYLIRECQIQTRLKHKNLVQAYSYQETPEFVTMDMEFCTIPLDSYVKRPDVGEKRKVVNYTSSVETMVISEKKLRPIARDIMRGLAFIHRQGIAHRDLKPENILLNINPEDHTIVAKIADFGLAKMTDDVISSVVGTPYFQAPETLVVRDRRTGEQLPHPEYSPACDMYSVGLTFLDLLAGSSHFSINYVREEDHLSPCCAHFISSMVNKNPSKRITADEALHHPFVMPTVSAVELVKPDTMLGVMGGRIHTIELGDFAFNRAMTDPNIQQCLKRPEIRIDWSVTWGDVAATFRLGRKDDFMVIMNGGRVFNKDDTVEYPFDSDIVAAFVPRTTPVPKIDRKIVAESAVYAVKKGEKMEKNGELAKHYLSQINARHLFCNTILRKPQLFMNHMKSLISFDLLEREMNRVLNEELPPFFPKIAFIRPDIDYELPKILPEDLTSLDNLMKLLDQHKRRAGEVASKPSLFAKELDSMRDLLVTLQDVEKCSYLEHSIEVFNAMLDKVRTAVSTLTCLMDCTDILKSAAQMVNPLEAVPKLEEFAAKQPCLRLSSTCKNAVAETPDNADDMEILILKEKIESEARAFATLKKKKDEAEKENRELKAKVAEQRNQFTRIMTILKIQMMKNGIQQ